MVVSEVFLFGVVQDAAILSLKTQSNSCVRVPCAVRLNLCGLDFVVRSATRHQSCLGWIGSAGAVMGGQYLTWMSLGFIFVSCR